MKNRKHIITTILLALACFALLPTAQAVVPAPDGGYPNHNTAEGTSALFSLTTGVDDTAIGYRALLYNTTGHDNTATGSQALYRNTTGRENTATGSDALYRNTTGDDNTATGSGALYSNTTGFYNTATGSFALYGNTTGVHNTANGVSALEANTTGLSNTANGAFALSVNTTGYSNTATGDSALVANGTGHDNTAIGAYALEGNRSGDYNTAVGGSALSSNSGSANTATGLNALLRNGTGHDNTAIGTNAGQNQTTGSNNVYVGAGINGIAGESNACRIASIFGQTAASGSAVFITSGNKLGTMTSSVRFKDEIKPMDKASEAILALNPVTFRYKKEIDPAGISQFGLVAEDVEKVNADLVVRDKEGKPYSVRYEAVNAMLLNEFLKEHRTVQEQEATIAELKKEMATVIARVKEHDSEMQKVRAQLELQKPPAQRIVNNQR